MVPKRPEKPRILNYPMRGKEREFLPPYINPMRIPPMPNVLGVKKEDIGG
jgi:hypothetical protein